ncbi:hypothetical protein ESCO_003970 [Escovopsis weberi]|uniref:Sister chromatid cohesion protein DCC1 n=1 Tax=Escovopsis weberi TaxID=150374 RepID=A0A0M9VX91_ESCWE|nr:hypothetical protein ESCO_003970 [Escovopsis weberi]
MSGHSIIPLRHAPDDRGYRLIELPPELQALLESDTPPVLTLESSDFSALLKTPSKTYALRQKNTSNSILLLTSRTAAATPTEHPDPAAACPENAPAAELLAISTIKETVELDGVAQQAPRAAAGSSAIKGKWHAKFGSGR